MSAPPRMTFRVFTDSSGVEWTIRWEPSVAFTTSTSALRHRPPAGLRFTSLAVEFFVPMPNNRLAELTDAELEAIVEKGLSGTGESP